MPVGILNLHLQIPGCTSLKEKRSRIKPLLARLHRQFNVSAAEIDCHDAWQEAVVACAVVSNDAVFNQRLLTKVSNFIESTFPDLYILQENIESL
jgi:uncharacterized protein YlxP (DUF503 family)